MPANPSAWATRSLSMMSSRSRSMNTESRSGGVKPLHSSMPTTCAHASTHVSLAPGCLLLVLLLVLPPTYLILV